ncbi:hypothetical protein BDB00DRAFT_351865 [Zychaea mexicana]|uniref:uncharacterized protein n=1 Tax=Zychaea mexicana TaxID=64656 RepID=UPI0022FE6649|nr:uncharacterized protein BDB00DRAFT_351865 [Zychaea mexicana]KAI9493955.1 hypothetical protein BDB00DRAFT_351865 [Zychaea mexicana]
MLNLVKQYKSRRIYKRECKSEYIATNRTTEITLAKKLFSYADWCNFCRNYAPKYEAVQRVLASSPTSHDVGVGKVNVETSPGLAARFFVQRLPTIVHIKDHQVRVIPADRMNDLVSLIEDQSWKDLQTVNGMTSPFSVIGTLVSYTGKMVKWASSMSSLTIVLLMFVLLAFVVIVPAYLPGTEELKQEAEEAKRLEQEKTKEIEGQGKSTAKPESSESTKQRKSKRID